MAIVAVSAMLINDGNRGGWIGAIFFSLGMVAALMQLIGGGNYVRVEPHGFTMGSPLRSTTIRWADVEQFTVVRMHHSQFVGYRVTGDARSRLAKINRATYAIDGMFGDTFGIAAAELTEILEQRRRDATAARAR
jgi:hypothetical protein